MRHPHVLIVGVRYLQPPRDLLRVAAAIVFVGFLMVHPEATTGIQK